MGRARRLIGPDLQEILAGRSGDTENTRFVGSRRVNWSHVHVGRESHARRDGQEGAAAGPVEPRTTSSGSKKSSSSGTGVPAIWPTRSSITRRPIDSIGWRTAGRGGTGQVLGNQSMNPAAHTTRGAVTP